MPASTLSVFTWAWAIAFTCSGLAITTRATNGDSTRDTAMLLPVASITTSSVASRVLPKPSSAVRVMSTRPACRSTPFSQITTSPKVRWMSMPITRRIRASLSVPTTGAAGRHDTYGSARAAQPGELQRRPATNASSKLMDRSACPHLRAPGASVPDARSIRRPPEEPTAETEAPLTSYRLRTFSSASFSRSAAG